MRTRKSGLLCFDESVVDKFSEIHLFFDKCLLFPGMYVTWTVWNRVQQLALTVCKNLLHRKPTRPNVHADFWLILRCFYVYKKLGPVYRHNYENLQCYLTLLMS
jgi:hypothetical protein